MMSIAERMKDFVEGVVKLIIDEPTKVEIMVSTTTKSVVVQIKVDKSDIGKVIGRKGRTISALKVLTTIVKNSQFIGDTKEVFVEIIEDENSGFKRSFDTSK